MLQCSSSMAPSTIVRHALNLAGKQNLNLTEVAQVVLGGRVCSSHGVRLMTEDTERKDLPQVLSALADTTRTLVEQAESRMSNLDSNLLSPDEASTLSIEIEKSKQDAYFLSNWAGKMACQKTPSWHYDA